MNIKLLKLCEKWRTHDSTIRVFSKYANKMSIDQIDEIIKKLYILEYNIIKGKTDQYYGFKLFLIQNDK
jgi:DNA polymerase III delta subunit